MIIILIGSVFSFVAAIIFAIFATISLTKEHINQIKSKNGKALCVFATLFLIAGVIGTVIISQDAESNRKLIDNYQLEMVDEVFQNGISIVNPTVDSDVPQLIICSIDGIEKGDFVDTNGKLVLSGKDAIMEYCKIKGINYGLLTATP